MKKEIFLYIPQPCHEDWNNMNPDSKGRFCSSCAKSVIDFTEMTDTKVLSFLSRNKDEICGRFNNEQLQRPIIETQLEPKKNWKYWLTSLAAMVLLTYKSNAQTTNSKQTDSSLVIIPQKTTFVVGGARRRDNKPTNNLLDGIVTDTDGNPLMGASIIIKITKTGMISDSLGRFSLNINILPDTFTITVAYIGFEKQEIDINKSNIQKLQIQLKEQKINLAEVIGISYGTRHRTVTMGGVSSIHYVPKITFYDKLVVYIDNTLDIKHFEIYPNPVKKNSSFHISIMDVGTYQIQILDNKSKLYLIQRSSTTTPKELININVPNNVPSGVYYIRLINISTKKQWVEKILIE